MDVRYLEGEACEIAVRGHRLVVDQPQKLGGGNAAPTPIARRGKEAKNIAKVAMARQLLTWVYYAMRELRGVLRRAVPGQARVRHGRPDRLGGL